MSLTAIARAIRLIIHDYIDQRLQVKIEKLEPDDPKYLAEQQKHQPLTWLEGAVGRVSWIQVVTHPLKMTYPHAHIKETTSLYCPPNTLPKHDYVSTHTLGNHFEDDVTGNAAALDIFGLLQKEHEGETLLQLCLARNADFISALHDDAEIAAQWCEAFATVVEPKMSGIASHTNAKQLYWPDGVDPYVDTNYVMLAPLHSSSLAHRVYEQIDFDRFSPESKEIREAVRNNNKHDGVARSYPDLAIQVIGGSNPQGISSLMSKRRGVNYLLASLPPKWQSTYLAVPLYRTSIFSTLSRRRLEHASLFALLDELQDFLATDPPKIMQTRSRVEQLVDALLDEISVFALRYQDGLTPGWTADSKCELSMAQQCWLDPGRASIDAEFAQIWLNSDWPTKIEQDFARWLNHQLAKKIDYLGDVEFRSWAKEMRDDQGWQNLIAKQYKNIEKQQAKEEV